MKRITDIGLIISALIIAAGLMFAFSKDLTAWLFILIAGLGFFKFIKVVETPKPPVVQPPVAGYQPTPLSSSSSPPPTPPPSVP